LAAEVDCDCQGGENTLAARVEQVLLDPAYAGFLEAAMVISDGAGRKTVNDLHLYETWCLDVAGQIAGKKVETLKEEENRGENSRGDM
jgi:iron complex transport system substrate-binding protein